jgi:hypothetical protein
MNRIPWSAYAHAVNEAQGARSTQFITIELTTDQLLRLDDLRADRNLTRDQMIAELVEKAKPHRRRGQADPGRQKANPWGQVWPG